MKRYLIVCVLCLFASVSFSQGMPILQDPMSAKLFNTEKYSGMRGTPFLADKWMKGTATTPRGVYKDMELKFNVYDNTLFFNRNDESFEFQDNITSFTLMPKPDDASTYLVYKRGVAGADLKDNQYVQVLAEGAVSVYKLDTKQVSEMSEVNAGVVKTITSSAKYYIVKNGQAQPLKLSKADIIAALSDKQDKVQAYINDKKLSFRKDAELGEVVKYYNSL